MDAAREFREIDDIPHVNWLGRLARTWAGRVLIGAVVSTGAGLLFALPSFSTKQWHMELRVYLAQFWGWCLVTPLIVTGGSQASDSGAGTGASFFGAPVGQPGVHRGLFLHFHGNTSAFGGDTLEFASAFAATESVDHRMATLELVDLLGDCGRPVGIPVLRAICEQRVEARAA